MSNDKAKEVKEVDITTGRNIAERRVSLGMTRQELGRQLGITHQQLHKYERGTNRITVSRLVDISIVLCVSVNELIFSTPEPDDNNTRRATLEFMAKYSRLSESSQLHLKYLAKHLSILEA